MKISNGYDLHSLKKSFTVKNSSDTRIGSGGRGAHGLVKRELVGGERGGTVKEKWEVPQILNDILENLTFYCTSGITKSVSLHDRRH